MIKDSFSIQKSMVHVGVWRFLSWSSANNISSFLQDKTSTHNHYWQHKIANGPRVWSLVHFFCNVIYHTFKISIYHTFKISYLLHVSFQSDGLTRHQETVWIFLSKPKSHQELLKETGRNWLVWKEHMYGRFALKSGKFRVANAQ